MAFEASMLFLSLSLCLEIKPVLLRPRPHLSALARSLLSRVICGPDDDDGDHDRRRRLFPRMSLRGLIHGKDKGKHATAHMPSRVGRGPSGLVLAFTVHICINLLEFSLGFYRLREIAPESTGS